MIPGKDKKSFYYKSAQKEIWKIDLERDKPYYPHKILEFSEELGPHEIVDYVIDFNTKIAYALTRKGDIIGRSLYSWVGKENNSSSHKSKK